MESNPGSAAEDVRTTGIKDWREVQAWYFKMSKLALAIAIIRSTPAGKSSKEYAEYLSKVICGRELSLRAETERLKGEVLRLRQELLMSKICPINENPSITSTSTSQCLDHGNSLKYSSQPEDDSGCDIPDEEGFDSAEMVHRFEHSSQCHRNLPSFKFSFSVPPTSETNYDYKETIISASTQFLQHLLRLRMLTKTGSVLTNFSLYGSDFSIISDSVFGLLDCLIIFCKNPNFLGSALQKEAVCVLTDVLTNSSLCDYLLKTHFNKLREFETDVIQCILVNRDINRFQVQHNIINCLFLLGRCSLLRKHMIDLLFHEINHFADELLHTCQANKKAITPMVNNTYTESSERIRANMTLHVMRICSPYAWHWNRFFKMEQRKIIHPALTVKK
ncbi:meiosis-specific protein MEI4 isoform X2 [Microcaecilia unicolor]|uniref:Meiosis-specific protein MEI4 isoform X2 n=1 Tax=Microcaecilia unicolor TaxID=1415580 RepID=A0A6P7XE42_9AMPH|nr:meiosis-specific protein MEI4 isoform X2 [Microcaecilia unicolor]